MADLLKRDERIRLEALAQAVASSAMQGLNEKLILSRASAFEKYIRNGAKTNGET
jgi:hypothetical protein